MTELPTTITCGRCDAILYIALDFVPYDDAEVEEKVNKHVCAATQTDTKEKA